MERCFTRPSCWFVKEYQSILVPYCYKACSAVVLAENAKTSDTVVARGEKCCEVIIYESVRSYYSNLKGLVWLSTPFAVEQD